MREERANRVKQILIIVGVYAAIFWVSVLYGKVVYLEEVVVDLLAERMIRMEQEQKIREYFEKHDEDINPAWSLPEENPIL